jgi:putative peptidoglycan lipid II flippase
MGRGVVQISAYVESMIASLLPTGGVAAIAYAQILYTLPTSLFGSAVAAASLPELAREGNLEKLAERLRDNSMRVAFFIVPSAVAFLGLGDVVAATIFQTGAFTAHDASTVWLILAGSGVGLLASTQGRLLATAFYALDDTTTPLVCAIVRVVVGTGIGAWLALQGPVWLDVDAHWGVGGIALGSSVAGVVEWSLLRARLAKRVPLLAMRSDLVVGLWGAAMVAASVARAWKLLVVHAGFGAHPVVVGALVLGPYGALYFAGAAWLGVPEAARVWSAVRRRIGR